MPNLDGGHYFLTVLAPIDDIGIVEHAGMKSSPVSMVRDVLETLPTALQSPATEAIGIQSPFARSLRTHFARLFILDDVYFNGRNTEDSIAAAIAKTNLLTPQPTDHLPCPYLVFVADFDPVGERPDEPRSYIEHLWAVMPETIQAVFQYCVGFDAVKTGGDFADFVIARQVETTMPFNDYWVGSPPLPSLSVAGLLAPPAIAVLLAIGLWTWLSLGWVSAGLLCIGLLSAAIAADYVWVMSAGAKPFPTAPNSTLRDVLKALYLQQRFTRFVGVNQGASPANLRAAFKTFISAAQPDDLAGPTQPAGVVK